MIRDLDHQGFLDDAMANRYSVDESPYDTKALHVSDLTQCVRAIYYRRNGVQEFPVTPARKLTMIRGLAIETEITEAIVSQLGRRWLCYRAKHGSRGQMGGFLLARNDRENAEPHNRVIAQVGRDEELQSIGIPPRAMVGHMDLYAWSNDEIRIYEIKSMPFLGPAPLTKNVMQLAGYELMVMAAEPTHEVNAFVIEVSAVSGEFRSHKIDRGAHSLEVLARLEERQWNTAPGDELPDPSIPDEMFALRGRAPNKRLVNLLCEKYCGFRACPENHVGETTVDE